MKKVNSTAATSSRQVNILALSGFKNDGTWSLVKNSTQTLEKAGLVFLLITLESVRFFTLFSTAYTREGR